MKKLLTICTIAAPMLFSSLSAFAATEDRNVTIKQVFTHVDGRIAIEVDALPAAIAAIDCVPGQTWDDKFVGISGTEPGAKNVLSTMLTADSRGVTVRITADGCEGNWHKLKAIYIE